MPTITDVAMRFFETCEAGKGWEACQTYCTPDASFSAQAEPLAGFLHAAGIHRLDAGTADVHAGRQLCREVVCHRRRPKQRVRLWRVPRDTHRPRWPPPRQPAKHDDRLCLCHGVRRREDPPHDKNLERRMGDEGVGLGLKPRTCGTAPQAATTTRSRADAAKPMAGTAVCGSRCGPRRPAP